VYFGNKTIGLHLVKGFLGFVALFVSLSTIDQMVWPSLILLPLVVYLWKGCPMCWTLGLIETIVMTIHKRNEGVDDSGNQAESNLPGNEDINHRWRHTEPLSS